MNPDPIRPPETDNQWMFDREADFYANRPTVPVVPLVIALAVIVGILVAWAVR